MTLLNLAILAITLGLALWILVRRRRSRQSLVARVAELTLLSEVGRAIVNAKLDVDRLAELTCRQAGQIVDTRFFQVGLFEADSYRTLIWVRDGERQPNTRFELTPDSEGIVGWMRRSQQPLLIRDFETERHALPARPRYVSPDPPRSAAFVPLVAGEQTIGAMAIQSRKPAAFSDDHLHLLTIIANQVAAALANARLFHQIRSRARELELIGEVSQQISALQPLRDLFRQVVDLIAGTFGYYAVNLFELSGERLLLRASTSEEFQAAPHTLTVGEGVVGRAAATRAPAVVQDVADGPGYLAHAAFPETRSELAVPLKVEEDVLGVLDVQSARVGGFPPESVYVVESLAAQLAIAILEARNYQAERRRAADVTAIARGASAVASILDLDDLLDEVIDLVEEHLGYRRASVFLLEGERLVFRAGVGGAARRWQVEGLVIPLDQPGLVTRVARSGQPVLAPDVSQQPDYRLVESMADTRSEMAVPLLMGDRVLGVFDVQSTEAGGFGPEDLQVLQTLAGSLAVAVRNARLFAAERRRRMLAETMREIATALASTLDLEAVLQRILGGLARLVAFDAAAVLMLDEPDSYLIRAATGPPSLTEAVGQLVELQEPDGGDQVPPVFNFEELDPAGDVHHLLSAEGQHVCLAATLVAGKRRLGYLVVARLGLKVMQAEELELIAAFASQASVAIENAALFTSQREEAWVSTALLQVAEASARAEQLEDVLEIAARLTALLVGVDRCGVLLARDGAFELTAFYTENGDDPAPDVRLAADDWPALAELLATGRAVVVAPDEPPPDAITAAMPGLSGVLILLPLLAHGQVAGAMLVGQQPGETAFTENRIRLLGGIAGQTALAIERAMLREARQEEAWVNMALLQVAEAVASELRLSQSLETVARLLPMLAGVRWAVIYRFDDSTGELAPVVPVALKNRSGLHPGALSDFTGTRLRPDDLALDPADPAALPAPVRPAGNLVPVFGTDPCLALPLWARGKFLGALVVNGPPPSGPRINLLTGFAHQLALAIDRARVEAELVEQQRLEREVEVAQDIQASFLPEACPMVPGWQVGAHWQVARRVGGDFYDFIPLPPASGGGERLGVVIADVADKGVPAALFMALSRTLLRATAASVDSPAETLRQVNDLILADTRSDLFVTVYYLIWEQATGRMEYAVAGHNPPVLLRAGDQPALLPGRGVALGILPGVDYHAHEITLAPGDVLLLYTDGITEAINQQEVEFGLQRLMDVATRHQNSSAVEMLAAIAGEVETHTQGMEAFDDMTMVVIKRLESANL